MQGTIHKGLSLLGCWGLEAIRVPLLVVRFQGAGGLGFKIDRGPDGIYTYPM